MSVGVTPLEILRAQGLPHRRMEDWKYSDVRSALRAETPISAGATPVMIANPDGVEQTFEGTRGWPKWADRLLATRRQNGAWRRGIPRCGRYTGKGSSPC